MGRTSSARERLLDSACDLIHERGYAAIGVAEICARADVRKGSFYHFFESKQALTAEAVDQHWAQRRAVWTAELSGPDPALARLERLVRAQASAQADGKRAHGRVRGCLFGNLATEVTPADGDLGARVAAVFAEQTDLVASALADAVAEGAVPADLDVAPTARAVLAHLEGMVLFARLADDPGVLDGLWAQTRLLIRAR
ncbi:TetR/AcrR family transcriptional regulator [Actinokineospora fastidiosa]|uniref:TetR family transcriptional regulator n=1 Tax=Actinokineospora fastidiosa TaxID=1816 RepID=A0A918L664_9PSEU|nr:TetR/AcrR family transcriptional regulator [Actinokineospora fastidiosa]GGS12591.1 TetR family transcriptional regulator [Actinokineospora fastidiosa]